MEPRLGVVAGGGDLPAQIIAACRARGRDVFVLALKGHADGDFAAVPHAWIALGEGGTGIEILKREGVRDIVLAGRVRRPSLAELRPDRWSARLLGRLGLSLFGDNALLATVVEELESSGFRVVAPETVLDTLLIGEGPLGRHAPDDTARQDIARAIVVARALGAVDVGQAVVVQERIVLGVEAIEGTDALLARCAGLRRAAPGGVLVKWSKPGQERRVDLPTVGVATVEGAARAGLRGIALEAGRTLVVGRDTVAARADALGLFGVVVRPDGP